MGILDTLATPAPAASATASNAKPDRAPSQVWLNIGVNIPGAGEDGKDLFVSIPVGLPLDDMKPIQIRGTNQHSINLKQVKNTLLDELQKLGAGMTPGDRKCVPQLQVEIYRVAKPEQTGTAESNPLLAGLFGAMSGN